MSSHNQVPTEIYFIDQSGLLNVGVPGVHIQNHTGFCKGLNITTEVIGSDDS